MSSGTPASYTNQGYTGAPTRWVGLDDLQMSLRTSTILWFLKKHIIWLTVLECLSWDTETQNPTFILNLTPIVYKLLFLSLNTTVQPVLLQCKTNEESMEQLPSLLLKDSWVSHCSPLYHIFLARNLCILAPANSSQPMLPNTHF